MSDSAAWEVLEEPSARDGQLLRVDAVSTVEPAAKRVLGDGVYVHDIDYFADGRAVAYLGAVVPADTTPAPGQYEVTFLNYAPVGAAPIEPTADEDALLVHLPDRDALVRAVDARRDREHDHRAAFVTPVLNFVDDRQSHHYEQVDEHGLHDVDSLDDLDLDRMEMFHLGRELGMQKMANLVYRKLTGRLEAPYDGQRRWASPRYEVIRDRRSVAVTDWPTPLDTEADP